MDADSGEGWSKYSIKFSLNKNKAQESETYKTRRPLPGGNCMGFLRSFRILKQLQKVFYSSESIPISMLNMLKGPLNPHNNFREISSLTCILKVLLIFIMVGASEGPAHPEKCL